MPSRPYVANKGRQSSTSAGNVNQQYNRLKVRMVRRRTRWVASDGWSGRSDCEARAGESV